MHKMHLKSAAAALRCCIGWQHINGNAMFGRNRFSTRAAECLRPFLPYCLHPVDDGSGRLIWLNRDYKPLGVSHAGHVDYEDFARLHVDAADDVVARLRKAVQKGEQDRCRFVFDDGRTYLFDDSTAPWLGSSNAQRLLALIELCA